MKLIFTILFFLCLSVHATTYYVANSGNDGNDGLTAATAWKTIAKVNATTFANGDVIKFKAGDSWLEILKPASSNITIDSFGTGAGQSIITGYQQVTGFTNVGNVWTASFTTNVNGLNNVMINGKVGIKGRYPNSTYFTFDSHSGDTSITSATPLASNYTGKEIVVKTAHGIIDVDTVKVQSVNTMILKRKLTYEPIYGGNGYFFQNDVAYVDSANEWAYDGVNHILTVYSTTSPTVYVSIIDTICLLSQKSNITFRNIYFTGANKLGVAVDTSNTVTFKKCSFIANGVNGVAGVKSHHVTVDSCLLTDNLSGGVYLRRFDPYTPMQDTCNYPTITNCAFKRIAIYDGMGLSDNERYMGIVVVGTNPVINNNTFDTIGYVPIKYAGVNASIRYNVINYFGFCKEDGGGIYTVIGSYIPSNYSDNAIIEYNIVSGGQHAGLGTNPLVPIGQVNSAIYLDDYIQKTVVRYNFGYNCYGTSLNLREPYKDTILNNTFINDSMGVCLMVNPDMAVPENHFVAYNNIYYQRNAATNVWYSTGTGLIVSDSNYYLRPTAQTNYFKYGSSNYTLASFQSTFNLDLNSKQLPNYMYSNVGEIFLNKTNAAIVQKLGKTYINAKGKIYQGAINIGAYSGVLLFPCSISLSNSYNYR